MGAIGLLTIALALLVLGGTAAPAAAQEPACSPATPPTVTIVGLKSRVPFDIEEQFELAWDVDADATASDARLVMRDVTTGRAFFRTSLEEGEAGPFYIVTEAGDVGPSEVVLTYVETDLDENVCLRTVSKTVEGFRGPARALTVDEALGELARAARRAGRGAFVEHGEWDGGCRRISRRRKRCRASGFLGDAVYGIRGTVWLTGRGPREHIHFSLTGVTVDEYCLHVTRAGNCVRQRRLRGSRRTRAAGR